MQLFRFQRFIWDGLLWSFIVSIKGGVDLGLSWLGIGSLLGFGSLRIQCIDIIVFRMYHRCGILFSDLIATPARTANVGDTPGLQPRASGRFQSLQTDCPLFQSGRLFEVVTRVH